MDVRSHVGTGRNSYYTDIFLGLTRKDAWLNWDLVPQMTLSCILTGSSGGDVAGCGTCIGGGFGGDDVDLRAAVPLGFCRWHCIVSEI